ncbi:tRNA-uridine aminocarboxypropyltransferase 2-like [Gigantopelta aegis]|uniref:tRNA-uridine aminocarboxypropyltransferase 2-like n=1 Tax=Gigantopelta aegis TaxID=1735272 RepID=UPI001B88C6E4|nr:tRNA-uridine aminocarboxypropyltransferase 2-like [Gigantopelta aegis]
MNALFNFAKTNEPVAVKRPVCNRCMRPATVCWCPYLPHAPVATETTVYILQHPFEESRCLKTAPMLYHSLPEGKCHIIKGKKFPVSRFPLLDEVMKSPNTLLLYPGPDAIDIDDIATDGQTYNLVLLDGTWAQAKGMYQQNPVMKLPRKVQIKYSERSKYVIRTQPTDSALSTLESAAVALSILEHKPDLIQTLTRPLVALCDFQIQHGAVQHQSREYKIEHGLWKKPLAKAVRKRLEKKQLKDAVS